MCKIKILGPPSEKYELLKNKLAILKTKWEEELIIEEIKDINKIIAENIKEVPSALFEGEENYIWTEHTTIDLMLDHLTQNRENRSHACRCGGGCRMRKLDPAYTCNH